jgi:hypothetical protein
VSGQSVPPHPESRLAAMIINSVFILYLLQYFAEFGVEVITVPIYVFADDKF